MGVTPILGFPYPGVSDAANPPAHIQALAEAVEAALNTTNLNVSALQTLDFAYYYQSGTPQSIPATTDRRILFNSSLRTTSSITTATVSSGTEFTVAKAGVFLIGVATKFDTSANDTERYLAIANSAGTMTTRYGQQSGPSNTATSSLPIGLNVTVVRPFAVNDKIAACAYQGSASAVSLLNNYTEDTRIFFARLGN